MIFKLPEYEGAARDALFSAVNALACAQSPLLAQIPSEEVAVIHDSRISGEQGEARYEPIKIRADFELDIEKSCAGDLGEILCAVDRLATTQVEVVTAGFIQRLDMVTTATGNEVNAEGGPLTHELIVELLEKMEIDFDDAGNPQLAFLGSKGSLKRFADLPPMTDEQQRAFDEVLARKRGEFEARRRRRLPDPRSDGVGGDALST